MNTKLDNIKELAIAFLYVDIRETAIPFVATHPFTNNWYVGIQEPGRKKADVIDLHDAKDVERWREQIKTLINDSDQVSDIFRLMNKAYIMNFLKYAAKYMSDADLGLVLEEFWKKIEQISLDTSISGRDIISWFRRADKTVLMTEKERDTLRNMPDEIRIYRGVTSHNRSRKKAFSWSLNKQTAEWFAGRFKTGTGEIWTRVIPKERILCYFDGNEQEVIVNLYGDNEKFQIIPHKSK